MKKTTMQVSLLAAIIALGGLFTATNKVQAVASATATPDVTVTSTVQETMTLTCGDAAIPNVTAGTPVEASASCTVNTNGAAGYKLYTNKTTVGSTATTTMKHSDNSTFITDTLTGYVAANPALWVNATTKGLGFRVNITGTTTANTIADWGTDDLPANAKFAAFPTATTAIYNTAANTTSAQTISLKYRLDVPTNQKAGLYTGKITYTATTN